MNAEGYQLPSGGLGDLPYSLNEGIFLDLYIKYALGRLLLFLKCSRHQGISDRTSMTFFLQVLWLVFGTWLFPRCRPLFYPIMLPGVLASSHAVTPPFDFSLCYQIFSLESVFAFSCCMVRPIKTYWLIQLHGPSTHLLPDTIRRWLKQSSSDNPL